MGWNRLVVFVLCCIIIALVMGALWIGPPKVPPIVAGASSVTPDQPTVEADLDAGVFVRSFGPVPGCGADATLNAIVALARRTRPTDRVLGVANVQSTGHSQVGKPVQWDCDAQIQTSRGQQHIRYQINQVTTSHDTWELMMLGRSPSSQ